MVQPNNYAMVLSDDAVTTLAYMASKADSEHITLTILSNETGILLKVGDEIQTIRSSPLTTD